MEVQQIPMRSLSSINPSQFASRHVPISQQAGQAREAPMCCLVCTRLIWLQVLTDSPGTPKHACM